MDVVVEIAIVCKQYLQLQIYLLHSPWAKSILMGEQIQLSCLKETTRTVLDHESVIIHMWNTSVYVTIDGLGSTSYRITSYGL